MTRSRTSCRNRILAGATTALAAISAVLAISDQDTGTVRKREFSLINDDQVQSSYDYVIVGGGLAGLVLASRLSEDQGTSVIVLEAGLSGDEVNDGINTPAGAYYSSIVGTDYDWQFRTTNQSHLNNRVVSWPRGKILGGSTAMNAMYLVRPASTELDTWSSMLAKESDTADGAERWDWEHMFEAMKKSENFSAPLPEPWAVGNQFPISAKNHGSGGPMQLGYPAVMISAVGNWTLALNAAGVPPLEEPNGGVTMGGFISPSSINQANWTRSYSRSAYIDSLPPRSNLHILPQATATKINWADKARGSVDGESDLLIANSVEFGDESRGEDGVRYVIGVTKEVLLAGGPLGSPKVLMHSGVGPKDVLEEIGLDVAVELPGVGQHLQDHLTAGVVWEAIVETGGDLQASNSNFSRTPEFLSFINDAVGFANITRLFGDNAGILQGEIANILTNLSSSTSTDDNPLTFASLVPFGSAEVIEGYKETYNLTASILFGTAQIEMLMSLISPRVISIQSALQHPYSRGRMYINSTNPFDPVVIDPNYFSHPVDRTIMRQGLKMVRDVGEALRGMGVVGEELSPGPTVQSDNALDGWLTNEGAGTQYHPTGSCGMLPRKWGGCVNSKLRVYGLANVRVADSSVYPFEFAAHLASATYGLAETAAEIVKAGAFSVPEEAKPAGGILGKKDVGGQNNGSESGKNEALGSFKVNLSTIWLGLGVALVLLA